MKRYLIIIVILYLFIIYKSFCKEFCQEFFQETVKKKVVVIGAGISGLTAAQILIDNNYDVTILEANNRIGGRIYTNTSLFEHPVDIGASWIHGNKNQPLMELVKKGNIITHEDTEMIVMYAEGTRFTSDEMEKFEKTKEKLWKWIENQDYILSEYNLELSGESIGKMLEINKTKINKNNTIFDSIIYNEIWQEASDNSGADLYDLDRKAFTLGSNVKGKELIVVNGMEQLLYMTATKDTISKVKFNSMVVNINYTDNNIIVKDINDNIYNCDYVVCSIPLGVLKQPKMLDTLFTPLLPKRIKDSYEMIKPGLLTKFFMLFPFTFWSDEDLIILLPENKTTYSYKPTFVDFIKSDNKWTEKDQRNWIDNLYDTQLNMVNISRVTKGKLNMLVATFPANLGWIAERLDQNILAEMIYVRLKKAFGKWWRNQVNKKLVDIKSDKIPRATSYYCTKWSTDKFSMGAYSYIMKDGTKKDIDNIRSSLYNNNNLKVVFCGEHTNLKYLATMTGAYVSGKDAANIIIKDNIL